MTDAVKELERIAEEQARIIAKFPGFEPESLKLQPAMARVGQLQGWHDTIRAWIARYGPFLEAAENHGWYERAFADDAAGMGSQECQEADAAKREFLAVYLAMKGGKT